MLTHLTIRSPIMTDAVWCTPTCGITHSVSHHVPRHVVSLIRSPIMSDAVWCTSTCGINYSVSHHVRCRLVHLDMWYQLNAIRHQDGCRLVHPAKWDISSMPYAIMTDADWGIPPSGTLKNFGVPSRRMPIGASRQAVHSIYHSIHIYNEFRLMNLVFIIIHFHSVFKYNISIPYSLTYYLFKDILNLYTYFIYSFTYSFHSYLVNYQNT